MRTSGQGSDRQVTTTYNTTRTSGMRTSGMRTSGIRRTSHRGEGRVIAENVYEGHIVSETEGKKRLIGVNEL